MSDAFTPDDAFGLLRSYSRHRDFVRLALLTVIHALERRALEHDASKMLDDEFAGFARINAVARVNKFGTPEYKKAMQQERTTVDLHFSRNRHHPEHASLNLKGSEVTEYELGLRGMSFLDVIEMVCDWWGARKGYDDNRMTWPESVKMNLESKGKYLTPGQRWLVQEVAAMLEAL